jgi:hypothetical protein
MSPCPEFRIITLVVNLQQFMALDTGTEASFAVRGAKPMPNSLKYCMSVSTVRMAIVEK